MREIQTYSNTNSYIYSFIRYFSFITECKNPKACTILLRGASKDVLNEVERNLQDALCVARNILTEPYIVYGGGAVEMAVGKVNEADYCIKKLQVTILDFDGKC